MEILHTYHLTLNEVHRLRNSPYKYNLLAICIFSRYAYTVPLRSKRGDLVYKALESIFEHNILRKIQTDRGELVNPHVKKVLLKYNARLYHAHSLKRWYWLKNT